MYVATMAKIGHNGGYVYGHRLFPYMQDLPSLTLYHLMNMQLTSNITSCTPIVTNVAMATDM